MHNRFKDVNMHNDIKIWDDIKSEFQDGILFVGNGASIAIDDKFNYKNIREKGTQLGNITLEQNQLFDNLGTENFEIILEYLYKASKINKALNLDSDKPKQYYEDLRNGLIKTLLEIHPQHNEISKELKEINNFINQFQVVIDLNYDLILYWALMNGTEKFKDFFGQGGDLDFRSLDIMHEIDKIIIYPHGNLALCKSVGSDVIAESQQLVYTDQELKVKGGDRNPLYSNILTLIREYDILEPLFVSEGTTAQKIEAIKTSQYLRTVFMDILPELKFRGVSNKSFREKMTFLGFSFGVNDEHLFKQLAEGSQAQQEQFKLKGVAISLYNRDSDVMKRAFTILKSYKLVDEDEIKFFDVKTCGWPQRPSTTD